MLLPEHCSIKIHGHKCQLAPSYVVSVVSDDSEYMLAVVCEDHKSTMEERLIVMQEANRIPPGEIKFEQVKAIVTDCIVGTQDDYVELELKRGAQSDREN
jgi:hypothetical protein